MDMEAIPPITWSNGVRPENFAYPIAYEDLDIPATQAAVTFAKLPPNAVIATCSTDVSTLRFRIDGAAASGSSGHLLPTNGFVTFYNRNTLQAASFAAALAVDTTLHVTYYILHIPNLEEMINLFPALL